MDAIWILGLFWLLFYTNRKIKKVEQRIKIEKTSERKSDMSRLLKLRKYTVVNGFGTNMKLRISMRLGPN